MLVVGQQQQAGAREQPHDARRDIYNTFRLQQTLSLMGCKPQHALALADLMFVYLGSAEARSELAFKTFLDTHAAELTGKSDVVVPDAGPEQQSQHGTPHTLEPDVFLTLLRTALVWLRYWDAQDEPLYRVACDIVQRRNPLVVLLAGTSGSGKSTMAPILASRLGINTVLSTDSVRQIVRSFVSKEENPYLHASTYTAQTAMPADEAQRMGEKELVIAAYKRQVEIVMQHVDRVIHGYLQRNESVVVEGVHLLPSYMHRFMLKHRQCVGFMLFISNQDKHRERFCVRAKYMTMNPRKNKYVKHFASIRAIQQFLCESSVRKKIPCVDNTSVDRSVVTVHSTVASAMRCWGQGGSLVSELDAGPLDQLHAQYTSKRWRSKSMLEVIRRKKLSEPNRPRNPGNDALGNEQDRFPNSDELPPRVPGNARRTRARRERSDGEPDPALFPRRGFPSEHESLESDR